MKISLNVDKCSMFFPTNLPPLTVDNSGPIEVNEHSLTKEQVTQLFMAMKAQKISVNPTNALDGLFTASKPQPKVTPLQVVPTSTPVVTVEEQLANRVEALEKMLKQTFASLKKSLVEVSSKDLIRLKDLESKGKNRNSVIKEIDKMIKVKFEQVSSSIVPDPKISVSKDEVYSTNVSDVVESDVELISFKPNMEE